MTFAFLHKICDVLSAYFAGLNEERVIENFPLVYELLDEMMDFGYPQTTEGILLKECIPDATEAITKVPVNLKMVTGQDVSKFRKPGIKHNTNEVFLDINEKVNLQVSAQGKILQSDISGEVKVRAKLSGIPKLRLGLNEKVVFDRDRAGQSERAGKIVAIEDVNFHPCVDVNYFESHGGINFDPPEGEFTLMTYRTSYAGKPPIWVEYRDDTRGLKHEILVLMKTQFRETATAHQIVVKIPVKTDATNPVIKTSNGTADYEPGGDCIIWKMKNISGRKEFYARIQYSLPSISSNSALAKPNIVVNFDIPYYSLSGIQVRYLKITETAGYKALPWVRYQALAGDYFYRI